MSTDDMQWQQDEQRMVRERAQQLETERLEREQLDEDERIEREDRAQRRLEAQGAHSNAEAPRHDETGRGLSFLSGMFGLFQRRQQDQAQSPPQSPVEAAPFVPPMHIPDANDAPVAAARPQFREAALVDASAPKRASNLVLLGVSAAVIGGALWAYTALKTPERMPTGLEGTTEEFRDSPPPGAASATPSSTPVLPDPAAQAIAAQQRPTVETAAAAILGSTAPGAQPTLPQEPVIAKAADHDQSSAAPAIAASAATTAADADATQQRIAQLETEVAQLRQLLSERPSASAAAPAVSASAGSKSRAVRKPVRVAHQVAAPAPVEVVPPPPSYNGRLLSVDMWNGKPSVVVSTGDPSDTRVRVMQPGESINGITLREASVQARSATFDVGSGRLVKLGVED